MSSSSTKGAVIAKAVVDGLCLFACDADTI
jgi:hypothetical protein